MRKATVAARRGFLLDLPGVEPGAWVYRTLAPNLAGPNGADGENRTRKSESSPG